MHEKIPPQKTGAKSDTLAEIELDSVQEAQNHFDVVKRRFLNINCWELFAGTEKAEFSLRDHNGELSLDPPKVGDYFRIKIPGLHNPTGDGYDWVQVEKFEQEQSEDSECLYIRVRPTSDPTKPDDTTAHFFDSKATSNFLIKREGKKISAEVHGRNEVPNTEDLSVLEKIRNSLVAVGGIIGGSKFQWKSLTEGLIKYEA